jgi:hypothetical protein
MRRPALLGLAAVLLPSALVLHETVYAVTGQAATADQHGYLAHALPLIGAGAGSLAVAALLLPVLGLGQRGERTRLRPFSIALALIALFGVQESVEAFALGGGIAQLAAAFVAGWLLLPASIALGAVGATAIEWLERAGNGLARLLAPRRPGPVRGAPHPPAPSRPPASLGRLSPLAFGLARRPPPLAG